MVSAAITPGTTGLTGGMSRKVPIVDAASAGPVDVGRNQTSDKPPEAAGGPVASGKRSADSARSAPARNLDVARLSAHHRLMWRIRAFEQQALQALADKLVLGAIHPSIGQEAVAAD